MARRQVAGTRRKALRALALLLAWTAGTAAPAAALDATTTAPRRALAAPVVGIAATPSGRGFWQVGLDGGIFTAGDARFFGSTGALVLNRPIVGMAATPSGDGYWLVASDGGVFGFGDARFFGSTGGIRLNQSIAGMAPARDGRGYVLVASDGGVFPFGSAAFYGSAAGACPGLATGIATSRGARGYWITFADGRSYAFSPSTRPPSCSPSGSSPAEIATRDLYARLNAERAARGLAPLSWDPGLAGYAASWSQQMAASGFRHSDIGSLLRDGRFNLVGENIAMGRGAGVTAGTLHVMWMRSDGHRANMLSPGYETVGIGVFCAADGTMLATQVFARHSSSGAAPPSGTPPVDPIARGDAGSATC